jgi:hypothetical protein
VLLRPVTSVEAEVLWTTGDRPDPPFSQVDVPGPLGALPAWVLPPEPGSGATWVITVHGRGADRREALRIAPALRRAGLTVLAVTYRNDAGAPPSPDGRYHLGDSEWSDVAAAVRYARAHGAAAVVLYGWSMGAAVIGAYLDREPTAGRDVAGVILDSPVLDWRATLRRQAAQYRLPAAMSTAVEWCTSARIGIDFDRFDLVQRPPRVRPPTLVIHGADDRAVPVAPGRALAAAAGQLDWPLRYLEIPGADHTAAWNVDPAGYESAVTAFCARTAPAARSA